MKEKRASCRADSVGKSVLSAGSATWEVGSQSLGDPRFKAFRMDLRSPTARFPVESLVSIDDSMMMNTFFRFGK